METKTEACAERGVFCAGIQNAQPKIPVRSPINRDFLRFFAQIRAGKKNINSKSRIFSRFLSNFQLQKRYKSEKNEKENLL